MKRDVYFEASESNRMTSPGKSRIGPDKTKSVAPKGIVIALCTLFSKVPTKPVNSAIRLLTDSTGAKMGKTIQSIAGIITNLEEQLRSSSTSTRNLPPSRHDEFPHHSHCAKPILIMLNQVGEHQ